VSNLLSKLNFTTLKRPSKQSPQEARRSNLIAKLEEQAELARHQAAGTKMLVMKNVVTRDSDGNRTKSEREKNIRPWFWVEGTGYALTVKYGAHFLEMSRGKKAITVPNLAAIPEVLSTIISACRGGELDAAIDAVVTANKNKPRG
jgi:hypothetical protein